MKLDAYYFPVEECPVFNAQGNPISGYKSIVKTGNNDRDTILSVVKDSYKLVTNRELILPFIDEISSLKTRWYIDSSHSFVRPERMRLQITFPDVYVSDSESHIPLSIYLHNSYDQSEGVRLFWGAIRAVCTNGMIMGDVLGSYYGRHTKGFDVTHIQRQFDGITDKITLIQGRITDLEEMPVNQEVMEQLQQALGKRRLQEIIDTDRVTDKSQWELYNDITYLISHNVEKPQRAELQLRTSKVFQL